MIPPTIPAISPEKRGAPLAKAIPRQRGNATKNTTILAGMSFLKVPNKLACFIIEFLINQRKYINVRFVND
jgi:hypothetical protein